MFPFDPPENIRKPLVQKGSLGRNGLNKKLSISSSLMSNMTNQTKEVRHFTEAATEGVLWKKVLLKISQNSRKTPVPESLF